MHSFFILEFQGRLGALMQYNSNSEPPSSCVPPAILSKHRSRTTVKTKSLFAKHGYLRVCKCQYYINHQWDFLSAKSPVHPPDRQVPTAEGVPVHPPDRQVPTAERVPRIDKHFRIPVILNKTSLCGDSEEYYNLAAFDAV
jgi:hypothetical protein